MSADLSASSGPTTTGTDELAEVLADHHYGGGKIRPMCSCGASFLSRDPYGAHRRHVAEVIAASGVVVPVAEVRALADKWDDLATGHRQRAWSLHPDMPSATGGNLAPPSPEALMQAAAGGARACSAADLRALLARLAGEDR